MAISTMSNSSKPLDDLFAPLLEPTTSSRPLSPVKSHYRPFSTIITPPPDFDASPSKSRRTTSRTSGHPRPLSSAFTNMGFLKSGKSKGKEKEEKPATSKDGFFNRTLRAKKSFNSLLVVPEESPPPSSTPPAVFTPSLASTFAESSSAGYSASTDPSSSASSSTFVPTNSSGTPFPVKSQDNLDYGGSDRFEAKENWNLRERRLKLHPYGVEAPYMQSYDSVSLSIDRYMHTLLRRLNSNGTPSFYDYAKYKKSTPTSILDLGCGEGHWVVDASKHWPDALIVGLDLVDITVPEVHANDRISFVLGNFVRYSLPFPRDTFDLIRIANLSLAIPADRWNYVLAEVYRVLQVGGRVELIDDAVSFPYGKESSAPNLRVQSFTDQPNRRKCSLDQKPSSFDFFDDEEDITLLDDDACQDENGAMESTADPGPFEPIIADEGEEEVSEDQSSGVLDDFYSEYPSSSETVGDGLFLDVEDSRSSASSLQDSEEPEDCSSLNPPSLPITGTARPLPAPRRPLPPIPVSPGPMDTAFPSTVADEDDDDIVTPTKLDATLPAPTLAHEIRNSRASERSESTSCSSSEISQEPPSPLFNDSDWSTRAKDGKKLEAIFYDMLEKKYGILTRKPKAIAALLKDSFGSENVRKLRSMHLTLAPTELEELIPHEKRSKFRVRSLSKVADLGTHLEEDSKPGFVKKVGMDAKKEKKSKKGKEHSVPFPSKESISRIGASTTDSLEGRDSSESMAAPNALSAKAAVRLGISYSALAAATKSVQTPSVSTSSAPSLHSNNSSSSVVSVDRTSGESRRASSETQTSLELAEEVVSVQQSPGLLLLPSTFLPMPPAELEMHACKHMHTLLGCKRALFDWLLFNEDGTENDLISEEELQDIFFEYDT
ncbi:hypothetical protein GYMLUDRAFT_184262 [Collybiopsis luxurians FD-317 M1]|nr:hypothetical protein GYMLUDRAFT_184262 [Collybiopsis luxurians FD-317 M1]